VIDEGGLVGIVSDRDVKHALEAGRGRKKKVLNIGGLFFLLEPVYVREIMTKNVVSIDPDMTAREAAGIMVSQRIGALPVIEDGKLVGILTETDLLRHLSEGSGG